MNELLYYNLKESSGFTPTLATQVAREIGRKVVSGFYKVGELIEEENKLAETYQVSRTVVRDGIKILVGKGLIEVRRGIGTKVKPRSNWKLLDDDVLAWHQSAPIDNNLLLQLIDIREIIEPKAAKWAAQRATKKSLEEIKNALEEMEKTKHLTVEFATADALFHRSILRASENEFLITMEGIIFSFLLSSINLTNNDNNINEESIPFHRDVYNAIVNKDALKAEKLMEKLINDAKKNLCKTLNLEPL